MSSEGRRTLPNKKYCAFTSSMRTKMETKIFGLMLLLLLLLLCVRIEPKQVLFLVPGPSRAAARQTFPTSRRSTEQAREFEAELLGLSNRTEGKLRRRCCWQIEKWSRHRVRRRYRSIVSSNSSRRRLGEQAGSSLAASETLACSRLYNKHLPSAGESLRVQT